MIASCKPNGGLKGNMIYSDENGDPLPGKEECTEGVGGARNETEECHIQATKCPRGLRSVQTIGGGLKGGCGVRCVKSNRGAPIQAEEH